MKLKKKHWLILYLVFVGIPAIVFSGSLYFFATSDPELAITIALGAAVVLVFFVWLLKNFRSLLRGF
ncbi:MAG: hypothetical protein J4224_05410 [Candidatus Diapherotrites archaeon]|uniref:Uncharacterized protein n=1 Tax=Candidatus Iainarchaeum sp. TaxID=3101447 RepID=A0A7J4IWD3_9ARCH|nr:MAG: hypothetical protein QT03_C0001G0569 [archaeon GW2011_AR10]MBS3059830.1 hypothetical protein [Candidatus Diapherotrites archaeon]HIH08565.1 hypothetical protein [Candidatus Diapherotrites archaeon]